MLELLVLTTIAYIAMTHGKKKRKSKFRFFKPYRVKKSKYDRWAYNPYNENRKPRLFRGM